MSSVVSSVQDTTRAEIVQSAGPLIPVALREQSEYCRISTVAHDAVYREHRELIACHPLGHLDDFTAWWRDLTTSDMS